MTTLEAPAPAQPPAEGGATRPARAVVHQLARVEARRFATHPVIWIAMALGTWMFLADLLGLRFLLPRESIHLQFATLPIGAAALFIAHLATTRPRRDDVTEVLEPAAHGEDARIAALLVAALTPAVLTAVLVAVLLGTIAVLGAPGPVLWAEAATAPAVVAAAGVLGVLVGRVAPWRLAPLFALVAVVVAQFFVFDAGAMSSLALRQLLGPIVTPAMGLSDPSALVRPAALHLAYVVGVGGVLAAVAVLVGRITVRRVAALTTAVAVAAAAGVAQLAPPSDEEVDALLARVGTPVEAGECTDDGTGASVCALPTFVAWRDDWVEMVRSVRQPLVDRGIDPGPLTVAQRSDPSQAAYDLSRWYDREELDRDPRMEAAWDVEYLNPAGTVLVTAYWLRGSAGADPSKLSLALGVAREATGLSGGFRYAQHGPDETVTSIRSCDPAGQAREPVTLWLAARADPAAAGALRDAVARGQATDIPLDLWTRSVTGPPLMWSLRGAEVALQLLDRPEVMATLAGDWDRWTDPSTSLRELVDEFDLDLPPADELRDTPLPAAELGQDGTADYADAAAFDAAPIGCP